MANRLRLDLVWFLAPQSPPVTVPFIATVWDLEHRNQPYFPEVSVSGWTWQERDLYYRSTLPRAACVVVGTEEGKRQLERYYAIPSSLIAVVPFSTPSFSPDELREDSEALSRHGIRSPFVFYPAQFWPHKNHATLLHAIKRLKEQGQCVDLVLTGSDKGNVGHVQAMTRDLGLEDQVRLLGFIDRRTIVTLYRHALTLVFPSFFGPDNLPPLEAFALGCPVVAAALPGTAELFGDAAILLSPTDDAAWAEAVRNLLGDPQRRIELVERGLAWSRNSTPADYVRAIIARLDAFEPVWRCWSRSERYVHAGVQSPDASEGSPLDLAADLLRLSSNPDDDVSLDHRYELTLAEAKADPGVRLSVIHALEKVLAASEEDRAARLGTIHTLQNQLEASEADRAARLDAIHALQDQLKASEGDRAARLDVIHRLQDQLEGTLEELNRIRVQLGESRSRIAAIELSRSWRWTRPIRWVSGLLEIRNRGG
jgi:glycosyltransferase involved in cell wall biosynthesis